MGKPYKLFEICGKDTWGNDGFIHFLYVNKGIYKKT